MGYISEYRKIKALDILDLELMPYFYLFTLLRSSFGYKGYIEKKKNGLPVDSTDIKTLEFAFWRTDLCKWLFDNADSISSKKNKRLVDTPPKEIGKTIARGLIENKKAHLFIRADVLFRFNLFKMGDSISRLPFRKYSI